MRQGMAAFFRTRTFKALLYLVYMFIILEGASRFILYSDKTYTVVTGDKDSSSWRVRWLKRHRDSKVNIFYGFDVHSSSRGWALKPLIRNMAVFGEKIRTGRKYLNSNSKGIRGKREYAYQRVPGKKRIVVIGDSFTFGDGVSDDETYSAYLEKLLDNTEVINMGVHGYGHDQMLIYLTEEGLKYSPDIVILGFVEADMSRNLFYFKDFAKPLFVLKNGRLSLTHTPVASPEEYLKREKFRLKILDMIHIFRQNILWKNGSNEKYKNELSRALLEKIVSAVKNSGAVPVFVYLPTPYDVFSPLPMINGETFFEDICSDNNILSLSLRKYFIRMSRRYGFPTHGHWDPKEHLMAAEQIKALLAGSGLLNP